MNKNILVTGGAGYIGSHTVKMLSANNYNTIVLDNLSRGNLGSVPDSIKFEKVDLLDKKRLEKTVRKYKIDAIIHFAAFAYVGESVKKPEIYYENNVVGSFNLIKTMVKYDIKKLIFSSTCSIYGKPTKIPISESETDNPINPYAKTKYIVENILKDFDEAFGLKFISLRYFNAAGADFEGNIGESHQPEPHLIPLVINTALDNRDKIYIYGDDYKTKDGTCIRDYIHVNDLAEAHVRALQHLFKNNESHIINLGTGKGYSVKEIIKTCKKLTDKHINFEIADRRSGDPPILIANYSKAQNMLNWSPKYNLEKIIKSAYNWHKNPKY